MMPTYRRGGEGGARGGGARGGARLDVQRVDVLLLELVLVHDLDGELVLVRPVDREPHRREGPVPQLLVQLEVLEARVPVRVRVRARVALEAQQTRRELAAHAA